MSASKGAKAHVEEELSLPLFLTIVAATLLGFGVIFRLLAPEAVWATQVNATAWKFVAAFLIMHVFTCFVEYFFHRYVLHKPVVPFLSRFYRQHTLHHNLTRIVMRRTPGGREVPYVENLYPMNEPEQKEASFFPWYTLLVFGFIVAPVLALLQWLAPSFPWFVSGFAALAWALILYEVFHAIEHWPFEKWAKLIEHPRWGRFWRKVYSFHLRHHAVIDCNEAISGFFTFPLADLVFGTWVTPKTLYADGGEWKASEFTSPKPCRLIAWCDEAADEVVQVRRMKARNVAPPAAVTEEATENGTPFDRLLRVLANSFGLILSAAGLALMVVFASLRGNAWHVASFTVFGVTLVLLYTAFTIYHSAEASAWRRVLRQYNHAAIFLVIAGTLTPFLVVGMRGAWGWSLFGIVWGVCSIGVAFQFLYRGRYRVLSAAAYALAGVLAVIAIKPFVATVPAGSLWLMLAGVVCYLAGIAIHLPTMSRFNTVLRQSFVTGGSACHILAVILFLLPASG